MFKRIIKIGSSKITRLFAMAGKFISDFLFTTTQYKVKRHGTDNDYNHQKIQYMNTAPTYPPTYTPHHHQTAFRMKSAPGIQDSWQLSLDKYNIGRLRSNWISGSTKSWSQSSVVIIISVFNRGVDDCQAHVSIIFNSIRMRIL